MCVCVCDLIVPTTKTFHIQEPRVSQLPNIARIPELPILLYRRKGNGKNNVFHIPGKGSQRGLIQLFINSLKKEIPHQCRERKKTGHVIPPTQKDLG